MSKSVLVKYVGCRLNQFEADYIKHHFIQDGYNQKEKNADICIINTCTVTQRADQKTRKMLKKIRKENPNALLVATGCMVETNKTDLRDLNIIDVFINNDDKLHLKNIIEKRKDTLKDDFIEYTADRTRPHLKIQDGCNHHCTYCKVRLARGKSRSVSFDMIIKTAEYLVKKGYKEIVLTGVNIGDYNDCGKKLKDLLESLINIEKLDHIRLSSIEPTNISNDLLKILKHQKICKYFHVPLQSGSNKILKYMKRPYTKEKYLSIVKKLQCLDNNVIIGSDIIVGFPGETEDDFQETYNFLKKNHIFFLHVFRYSSREKTEAYNYKNTVQEKIKIKRHKILESFKDNAKKEFYKQLINKKKNVIIENKVIDDEYITALSSNYIPVLLPYNKYKTRIGEIVPIIVEKVHKEFIYGK